MKEISNELFCELSQDELLNVVGGNRVTATTCKITGHLLLFKGAPAISAVGTPLMGVAAGAVGVALYGAGLLFSKEDCYAY